MAKTVLDPNTSPKRILIRMVGSSAHEEAVAGGVIRPGDLVDVNSAGKVVVHPTAGGAAEKMFALEDALQGKGVEVNTGDVNASANYASGDVVSLVIAKPGDIIYAFLAGGENATLASFLTSNGAGALKVASGSDIRIAKAIQAVNASDSNDVDERIRVRVL